MEELAKTLGAVAERVYTACLVRDFAGKILPGALVAAVAGGPVCLPGRVCPS